MNHTLSAIADTHKLRKSGSRYVGPCPQCGGSGKTDKFVLFDDGGFKCFACDFKGDRIKWLRQIDGMTCKEAHDSIGKRCQPSCPQYGPCRDGKRVARVARSVSVQAGRPVDARGVAELHSQSPSLVWQTWAEALVAAARATLAQQPEEIAWLAARGIPAAAIDRGGLGWLAHDLRVPVAEMGLPVVDGGKDRRWIPGGLVIPVRDRGGRIHRLRIRRTPASRAKFLPDRKYEWVKGSGNEPMVMGEMAAPRGVVVVEAELDALAVAAAHPGVLVVALGSVSYGLPPWLRRICQDAPVVLVALDADAGTGGAAGAGPKAVQRWQASFRQARYWPVPAGKDPGDYARDHGGDLQAWIEAGLPPRVQVAAQVVAGQDHAFSPDGCRRGGGGVEKEMVREVVATGDDLSPVAVVAVVADGPVARVLTLQDGREIHVVDDEQLWHQLAGQGLIVFSAHELARLQAACAGMTPEEKWAAVDKVVTMKQIFGSAYVRRGEVRV